MLQEFLQFNIFAYFLVVARIGTAMMFLPGFAASYVSPRIRLAIALALSLLVTPFVSGAMPPVPASPAEVVLLVTSEIFVGAFIGGIALVLLSTLQMAGSFISIFSSLANALINDPIAEQQSSIISNFLTTVGLLLIFVTDLHHLMLEALIDSYSLFVPGGPLVMGDFAMVVARKVADSFRIALQISAPAMILALVYYVGLGLLGRLMPTLPLFFFFMPIQISAQFWVMMVALSGMMMAFLQYFQEGFTAYLAPFGG